MVNRPSVNLAQVREEHLVTTVQHRAPEFGTITGATDERLVPELGKEPLGQHTNSRR